MGNGQVEALERLIRDNEDLEMHREAEVRAIAHRLIQNSYRLASPRHRYSEFLLGPCSGPHRSAHASAVGLHRREGTNSELRRTPQEGHKQRARLTESGLSAETFATGALMKRRPGAARRAVASPGLTISRIVVKQVEMAGRVTRSKGVPFREEEVMHTNSG
jgi:hypothetical protein